MPKRQDINSILIIGSGPIVIGQACEFDYSGVQACLALKEEGYKIILINSNPASIMTDPELADVTYVEPITLDTLQKIIEIEKPDALLPTMGGQTALNCATELYEHGILKKYHVELIGATYETIQKAENRELFKKILNRIGLKTPLSYVAFNRAETEKVLTKIGLPAIIRPSFTLGGFGGGMARSEQEYFDLCTQGLSLSPHGEIQIDESIYGWKEYELELIRDKKDNVIVICSIENVDPVGIHTGDSITVAPIQTLTDKEYQYMRNAAIAIMRAMAVDTGGANVQFAVNPKDGTLLVIEMNPRVSRSSALASKATGYPIARIAAKLAVGYTLDELSNEMTSGNIPAAFEPTIDYVVTKISRFDLEKFPEVSDTLGSQMKSVGEVMSIGRTFQESLQKAINSLEKNFSGLEEVNFNSVSRLTEPTPYRFLFLAEALRSGQTINEIQLLTKIDPWFLHQIKDLVVLESQIRQYKISDLDFKDWTLLKQKGFSDLRLSTLLDVPENEVRDARKKQQCFPIYNKIDTCAAEFLSQTEYRYSSYQLSNQSSFDCELKSDKILVIGSGPNRIGQGIEFDYCCVHAIQAIKTAGLSAILINCNPETVSTDYNIANKLYFDPVTFEKVMDIIDVENPKGIIVQFGGQTPLKLVQSLHEKGVPILGSNYHAIKKTECRDEFQALIKKLGLLQPANATLSHLDDAQQTANRLQYPLIVRPSYVIGGAAMKIIQNHAELKDYLLKLETLAFEYPLLLEHFIEDAIEIDVDAVCDGYDLVICGIMEHVERAGVHSGDSACYFPTISITDTIKNKIKEQLKKIALEVGIIGLMNGQFAIKDDRIYIIEINARSSRTIPFISKATGISWVQVAVNCILGISLEQQEKTTEKDYLFYAVKEAVFPFNKLPHSIPLLGPEMKSTGEVMGLGKSSEEAFYKAQLAAGFIATKKYIKKYVLLTAFNINELEKYLGIFNLISQLSLSIIIDKKYRQSLHLYEQRYKIHYDLSYKKINEMLLKKKIIIILNFSQSIEANYLHLLRLGIKKGIPYATTLASAEALLTALMRSSLNYPSSLQSYRKHCANK